MLQALFLVSEIAYFLEDFKSNLRSSVRITCQAHPNSLSYGSGNYWVKSRSTSQKLVFGSIYCQLDGLVDPVYISYWYLLWSRSFNFSARCVQQLSPSVSAMRNFKVPVAVILRYQ
jgi:hypothetical protein